jgi:membrane protein YdbS with pleckstrin-like domain
VFRAAPSFFTLRIIRWAATQLFALTGVVMAFFFLESFAMPYAPSWVFWTIVSGHVLAAIALLFQILAGWMIVRLDFELRWYMVSDRAIRIREGIATIREKTIALANIQNIAVRQGPLQRFLGISDVEVKTAGGGGQASEMDGKGKRGEPMHVAYFRGVDNAEEIRDLLREGVRLQRNAGLGDPDEHEHSHPGGVHAAAAELLSEARKLKEWSGGRLGHRPPTPEAGGAPPDISEVGP